MLLNQSYIYNTLSIVKHDNKIFLLEINLNNFLLCIKLQRCHYQTYKISLFSISIEYYFSQTLISNKCLQPLSLLQALKHLLSCFPFFAFPCQQQRSANKSSQWMWSSVKTPRYTVENFPSTVSVVSWQALQAVLLGLPTFSAGVFMLASCL